MYSVHLLHRYCFRPVLRRLASRRRPAESSIIIRQRARLRSRARNGRRPPTTSRHRYRRQLCTLHLRSRRSCPRYLPESLSVTLARLLEPRGAAARQGRVPPPRPASRAAPLITSSSGNLRSTDSFSFQMDMKSVGSFYYDNFVSIPRNGREALTLGTVQSVLSLTSICRIRRPSPAWCRTNDPPPIKPECRCTSRRPRTSS